MLIEYDVTLVPEGGKEVCRHMTAPVQRLGKDPAGHAFHLFALKQAGLYEEPSDSDEGEASTTDTTPNISRASSTANIQGTDGEQPPPGVTWKKDKKKRKNIKKRTDVDYYELLGLQHDRWMATEQQLKTAYRKACLEHHPDKKMAGLEEGDEEEKERIEEHFKRIQEAYDTLSDAAKRREYDSTDNFDDTLPAECEPCDFFKVFGPAFRRNARWSVDPKVPDVGDEGADWDEVQQFYDFWFAFKSWREFPHPDEEDVEGAESREHRRWIERENAKLRIKGKKEEQKRLKQFVENAYRLDPRVLKKKEEERMERERKKQEKEAAMRRQQEEEERKRREEEERRIAKEEEEKKAREEAKKLREAEKRLIKKERQKLRASFSKELDNVERLCTRLDYSQLQELNERLATLSEEDARIVVVDERVRELDQAQEEAAKAQAQQNQAAAVALKNMAKKDHAKKMAEMREWTEEELRLLDKAVKKYPQGTPKRWEQVTSAVRTRTMDEVLLMVKHRQGAGSARLKKQEDWKAAQKNPAMVKAEADLRALAFTDVQVNLVSGPPNPSCATEVSTNGSADKTESMASTAKKEASPPGETGVKKVVSSDSGEWTEVQELALVKALKMYGKDVPDRWDRIAEVVEGKSKAQCFKRFKELREMFKKKGAE